MENNLTTVTFWSDYWRNIKIPVIVDYSFKNDRVIAKCLKKHILLNSDDAVLEVGCAPGKWMGFLGQEYKCRVTGIEYVAEAAAKTVENMKALKIKNYEVLTGDFFNLNNKKKFNAVMSFGFIEHFDDFEHVLDLHLDLIEKNGYLIIGIPRFIGLNYLMQKIVDSYVVHKLLPSHNLKTMNLNIFSSYAKKNNLKVLANSYVGGYEPGLFPLGQIEKKPIRILFKILNKILNALFGHANFSWTASYQMAIMKKNE